MFCRLVSKRSEGQTRIQKKQGLMIVEKLRHSTLSKFKKGIRQCKKDIESFLIPSK
jgi:hypothetical protein